MPLTLTIENVDRLADGGPLRVEVERRGLDIGRDQHLDWTLPDPSRHVSGKHCEVRYRDGGYWLHDVSTNGTFVNGATARLDAPHRLRHGDKIVIGSYVISAAIAEDAAAEAAAAAAQPQTGWGLDHDPWGAEDAAPPVETRDVMQPRAQARPGSDFLEWAVEIAAPARGEDPFSAPPATAEQRPFVAPAADDWFRAPPAPPPPEPQVAPPPVPRRPPGPAAAPPPLPQSASPPPQPAPQPAPFPDAVWTSPAPAAPPTLPPATPLRLAPEPAEPQPAAEARSAWEAVPPPVAPRAAPEPERRPPEPAAPPPAAAVAASARDGGEVLRRIARAAGIPEELLAARGEAAAEEIGTVLRLVAWHLAQLLASRAETKSLMRSSSRTMIAALENNPLKFSATPEEALRLMFGPPTGHYLDARSTIEKSFTDLKAHQVQTYAAMQGALERLFEELAPEKIDQSVAPDRGLGSLVGTRKARLWDAYVERWKAKAGRQDGRLTDAFMLLFAQTYDALQQRDRTKG